MSSPHNLNSFAVTPTITIDHCLGNLHHSHHTGTDIYSAHSGCLDSWRTRYGSLESNKVLRHYSTPLPTCPSIEPRVSNLPSPRKPRMNQRCLSTGRNGHHNSPLYRQLLSWISSSVCDYSLISPTAYKCRSGSGLYAVSPLFHPRRQTNTPSLILTHYKLCALKLNTPVSMAGCLLLLPQPQQNIPRAVLVTEYEPATRIAHAHTISVSSGSIDFPLLSSMLFFMALTPALSCLSSFLLPFRVSIDASAGHSHIPSLLSIQLE